VSAGVLGQQLGDCGTRGPKLAFIRMLEDRSYMREPDFRGRTFSPIAILMMVLGGCFILQAINWAYLRSPLERHFVLDFEGVLGGKVWQILTYQFLHGSVWHLLMNLLCLWIFGRAIADQRGMRQMLTLFFLSGVAGALVHLLVASAMPDWRRAVVGASAGTSGLLAAFCLWNRSGEIMWSFILPIPTMFFLYLSLFISAFLTFVPVDPGVAHTAHLGGLLAGMAMVRWGIPEFAWLSRLRLPARGKSPSASKRTHPVATSSDPVRSGDFMSREIDPILEKISNHGIHSLTEQERKTLEAARERINRR